MRNYTIVALIGLIVFFSNAVLAQCQTNVAGNWESPSTWTNCGGGIPNSTNNVTIRHNVTISSNRTVASVTFESGPARSLTISSGTLTVTGNYNTQFGSSTSLASGATLIVQGTLTSYVSFTVNGRLEVGTLNPQQGTFTIGSTATVEVTTFNISSGNVTVNIAGDVSASSFSLTGGGNVLNIAATGKLAVDNSISIGSTSGGINVAGGLSGSDMTIDGSGRLNVSNGGSANIVNDVTLTGSGIIDVDEGGYMFIGDDLNLTGGTDVFLDGNMDVVGNLGFENNGNNVSCTSTGGIYYGTISCPGFISDCNILISSGCRSLELLPVTLVSFTAAAERASGSVLLKWATSVEENNSHFEVERSVDGRVFTKIATVLGKGTFEGLTNYQLRDFSPLNGTNYYRLKQVDTDGTTAYSKVVAANLGALLSPDQVGIFFNPVSAVLEIQAQLGEQGRAWVSVADYTGKEVKKALLEGNQLIHLVSLPNALPAGLYVVRVQLPSVQESKKILIP